MKEGKTIFNTKNDGCMRNLSQKLFISFNESKYHLEYQFLCLRCIGISVNPHYCKHCKYSYCKNCIQAVPASKIICLCTKSSKQNFEFQISQELFNTHYFIQDKTSLEISQISYSESLTWHYNSPYLFIPSENVDPTIEFIENYNENCPFMNLQVSRHKTNYLHSFSLNEVRLINFNFAKGYQLYLFNKILCENDGNFLRAIHLVKIELKLCLWNLDFSFSLTKAIRRNKNTLKEIIVCDHSHEKAIYLKSYLIIFNALTFCTKLDIIEFRVDSGYFKGIIIPKSFYESLSNSYILKEIKFHGFVFHDDMNFKMFQSLLPLQYLSFQNYTFNFNSFGNIYQNNFPKMQKLALGFNDITNSFPGENIGPENPLLHQIIKFPSILYLALIDSRNSLENLLFEQLIKSESIKLKYLEIYFCYSWNLKPIPNFF